MVTGEKFNTLAQSGTADFDTHSLLSGKLVFGAGADLNDKATWKGKAKRKIVTQISDYAQYISYLKDRAVGTTTQNRHRLILGILEQFQKQTGFPLKQKKYLAFF